jgi:Uncharacterised nucleotidyltransferase
MTPAFLTPVERLCFLLSYERPSATERTTMRALAGALEAWDELWTLADANHAAPLVHRGLRRTGVLARLPAAVRGRFERRAAQARWENEARLARLRPVLEMLAARRLPVAVLKGAFFAEAIYRDRSYKRMSDLDLFVRRDDLARVYAVYDACGLRCLGSREGRERYTHHGAPHAAGDLTAIVDTQWGLVTPLGRCHLDYEAIWARSETFGLGPVALRCLGPEDNLHHLCLHLGAFKIGLGDLADLYNLLRHAAPRFRWGLFLDEVAAAGSARAVYRALALAQRVCPMAEVEEALGVLAPRVPARARRRVRARPARLSVLLRIGTDHLEQIHRHAAVLGAACESADRWRAFLRLWRAILAPPAAVAQQLGGRIPVPARRALTARVAAPWRLLGAIGADVGVGWLLAWIVWSLVAVLRVGAGDPARGHPACDPSSSA